MRKKPPNFPRMLRQIKKSGDYSSDKAMAEALGIDPAVISRIMSGRQKSVIYEFGAAIVDRHAELCGGTP